MTSSPFACAISLDTALMVLRTYANADDGAEFAEIVPLLQLRLKENDMKLEDIEMKIQVLLDKNDVLMDMHEQARNTVSISSMKRGGRGSTDEALAADRCRSTLSNYDAGMARSHNYDRLSD